MVSSCLGVDVHQQRPGLPLPCPLACLAGGSVALRSPEKAQPAIQRWCAWVRRAAARLEGQRGASIKDAKPRHEGSWAKGRKEAGGPGHDDDLGRAAERHLNFVRRPSSATNADARLLLLCHTTRATATPAHAFIVLCSMQLRAQPRWFECARDGGCRRPVLWRRLPQARAGRIVRSRAGGSWDPARARRPRARVGASVPRCPAAAGLAQLRPQNDACPT